MKDLWKKVWAAVKAILAQIAVEKVLAIAGYIFHLARRMRRLKIPERLDVDYVPTKVLRLLSLSPRSFGFAHVDPDVVGEVTSEMAIPEGKNYWLISFHIPTPMWAVSVVCSIFSFRLATLSEVLALGQQCVLPAVGIDPNQPCFIAAGGTIIKRQTSLYSFVFPMIVHNWAWDAEGQKMKMMRSIYLFDNEDDYLPVGYYLVREK